MSNRHETELEILVAADSDVALTSIAISLKRIADTLATATGPCNEYGETLPEAIAGNLKRMFQEGWHK